MEERAYQFDLTVQPKPIIKVVGVGGGGSNAVNYMHSLGIGGVDFVVCNTDAQSLATSQVPNKVQLGPSLTQGLGAGANPEIGRQATEESLDEIRRILGGKQVDFYGQMDGVMIPPAKIMEVIKNG